MVPNQYTQNLYLQADDKRCSLVNFKRERLQSHQLIPVLPCLRNDLDRFRMEALRAASAAPAWWPCPMVYDRPPAPEALLGAAPKLLRGQRLNFEIVTSESILYARI